MIKQMALLWPVVKQMALLSMVLMMVLMMVLKMVVVVWPRGI